MDAPRATVHTSSDIERMLMLGLSPITDNAEALVALGFERSYPQARAGYESTIFERSVDRGVRETPHGLRRVMVCERAFLVAKPGKDAPIPSRAGRVASSSL
jgi:hypothetical protein